MSMDQDLGKMALDDMKTEALELFKKMKPGEAVPGTCPAHPDQVKVNRLTLGLLLCQLASATSPRRTGLWAGFASAVSVILVEVARAIITAHGSLVR